MTDDWTRAVLLTRLGLELAPRAPCRLGEDPDRLLRGLLGRAVFDVACAREHRSCEACDLRMDCDIPGWYDPGRPHAHAPRPALPRSITPAGASLSPGEPWRAEILVLGAIPRPSLLVEALVRLGRNGLGPERAPLSLARLEVQGAGPPVALVREERQVGRWPAPGPLAAFLALPGEIGGVEVQVESPLSWTGARPDREPTAGDLLWAALGRVRQVSRAQGLPQPPPWPDPRRLDQPWDLAVWEGGSRRTSGDGVQDLSGWTGKLTLGPEIGPWASLLAAGAVLGLGRSVSAGRGRIALDWR